MPVIAFASLGCSVLAALVSIDSMTSPVGNVAELLFLLFAGLFVLSVLVGGDHAAARGTRAATHRGTTRIRP